MKKILLSTVALAIFTNCTGNVNATESEKPASKFTDQRMQEISEGLKYITDTAIEYIHKYKAILNKAIKLNKKYKTAQKEIKKLNQTIEQQNEHLKNFMPLPKLPQEYSGLSVSAHDVSNSLKQSPKDILNQSIDIVSRTSMDGAKSKSAPTSPVKPLQQAKTNQPSKTAPNSPEKPNTNTRAWGSSVQLPKDITLSQIKSRAESRNAEFTNELVDNIVRQIVIDDTKSKSAPSSPTKPLQQAKTKQQAFTPKKSWSPFERFKKHP